MNMKFAQRTSLAFIAASLLSQAAFADSVTVKTGYDYSSGNYGTSTTTEITSIPFIASYDKGDWNFKLVLPYVRVSGANNVIPGVGATSSTSSGVRTESGLGDLTLSATHSLFFDEKAKMGVDVTGKVKFGTADEDKGLGTGENDYWAIADIYKKVDSVTYFGGVGYGILGDSPQLELRNVISANIGASYKLDNVSSIGATFDTRTKSTDNGYVQREVTAFYMHKFDGGYKLQAYATKGFADGSPDWGAGMNIGSAF